MSGARPPVCEESGSWGAELALGLLSGPERAAGLSHVAACPSCRDQVDELARVADRLLLLAPEAEPAAGFESRVLAAVQAAAPSSPRTGRGRRVSGLAAALVAVAVLSGVVGFVARTPSDREPTALRTGLAVSTSGRTSCRVVISGDRPASVLVSLDGYPGADTDVTVELETVTGTFVPLGPLHVAGGHGLLVTTLDLQADDLRLMRMLAADGRVIYEATLHDYRAFTAR